MVDMLITSENWAGLIYLYSSNSHLLETSCVLRHSFYRYLPKKINNLLLKYSVQKAAPFPNKSFPLSLCQIVLKFGTGWHNAQLVTSKIGAGITA